MYVCVCMSVNYIHVDCLYLYVSSSFLCSELGLECTNCVSYRSVSPPQKRGALGVTLTSDSEALFQIF